MTILSVARINQELAGIVTTCLDNSYGAIEYQWLTEKFLPFWSDWRFRLGSVYVAENWDCDKFARAFQSQMHIACFTAKSPVTAAIAFLATNNPSHALNLIRTEKGWFEIEPQNNEIRHLRADRHDIRYAIF